MEKYNETSETVEALKEIELMYASEAVQSINAVLEDLLDTINKALSSVKGSK